MAGSRGAQGMDEREAIWLVEKEGAGWSEPKNLSEKPRTEGNDSMAKVTPDGGYLFFQSDRRGSGASRGLYWVDAKVIDELKPPK